MAPAIPDRWEDYKPVGRLVRGTRFIAFKVPLREKISQTVEEHLRLDGKSLLKQVPNLGIIIDLTNTSRYYNPEIFKTEGVKHEKIMVPGHITPSKDLVQKFNESVKCFLKENKDTDKLIGVHCTHGVNRTGFFICNYMISEMRMNSNEAIARFDVARGHKIERENYLEALRTIPKDDSSNRFSRSLQHLLNTKTFRGGKESIYNQNQQNRRDFNQRSSRPYLINSYRPRPAPYPTNYANQANLETMDHRSQYDRRSNNRTTYHSNRYNNDNNFNTSTRRRNTPY